MPMQDRRKSTSVLERLIFSLKQPFTLCYLSVPGDSYPSQFVTSCYLPASALCYCADGSLCLDFLNPIQQRSIALALRKSRIIKVPIDTIWGKLIGRPFCILHLLTSLANSRSSSLRGAPCENHDRWISGNMSGNSSLAVQSLLLPQSRLLSSKYIFPCFLKEEKSITIITRLVKR